MTRGKERRGQRTEWDIVGSPRTGNNIPACLGASRRASCHCCLVMSECEGTTNWAPPPPRPPRPPRPPKPPRDIVSGYALCRCLFVDQVSRLRDAKVP
jgi:hypothetical protein